MLFVLLDEQFHGSLWDGHLPDGVLRFGVGQLQGAVRVTDVLPAHRNCPALDVHIVQPQGRQFTFSQSVVQIQIEHVQEYPHPSSLQVVPDVLQRQDFHVQFSGIRDDAGTNNKLVIV